MNVETTIQPITVLPLKVNIHGGRDHFSFEESCRFFEHALKVLEPWGPDVTRKVMQDNAANLYHIDL